MGSVVELLGKRRGQMLDMEASGFVLYSRLSSLEKSFAFFFDTEEKETKACCQQSYLCSNSTILHASLPVYYKLLVPDIDLLP